MAAREVSSVGGCSVAKSVSSRVLTVYSVPRAVVYSVVVSRWRESWTVRTLQQALPHDAGVRTEAVRSVLYLLLADGIVEAVAAQRSLTVHLTDEGLQFLIGVLSRWSATGSGDAAYPATVRDRTEWRRQE